MCQNSEAVISLCLTNYTEEIYMYIQSTNVWWSWNYHNWVITKERSVWKCVCQTFQNKWLKLSMEVYFLCRGVHGINEEMSNLVVDFQDRTDIFLALSSSCLFFFITAYLWVLGRWVSDLHRKRKLRVMTVVTTTAWTSQAGNFITM